MRSDLANARAVGPFRPRRPDPIPRRSLSPCLAVEQPFGRDRRERRARSVHGQFEALDEERAVDEAHLDGVESGRLSAAVPNRLMKSGLSFSTMTWPSRRSSLASADRSLKW